MRTESNSPIKKAPLTHSIMETLIPLKQSLQRK